MKLPTVLVISICSSSLTYSSGSQLALGNAASSLHTKRKQKKNCAKLNAIAMLITLIITPIVMNVFIQLILVLKRSKKSRIYTVTQSESPG